jgi:hypothetical protein
MLYDDDGYGSPDTPPCGCGRPARGLVTDDVLGQHWCRQCSPEHCELRRYVEGRERRSRPHVPGLDGVSQLLAQPADGEGGQEPQDGPQDPQGRQVVQDVEPGQGQGSQAPQIPCQG